MCSIIKGAVVLQPINRFGRAEVMHHLECTGSETYISQCEIDSVQVEVAGVVCQSMYV